MKKFNTEQIIQYAFIGTGFYLVYTLFKGIGIIKSPEQQAAETANAAIDFKEWTKPNFYKQPAPAGYSIILFTQSFADKLTKDLKDSTGVINDCEECMQGILKQIKYKTQYSFLADNFFKKYGQDLTAFLKDYFNEKELYPAWKHLNEIPTYKKK
jgi:hypothetical protein